MARDGVIAALDIGSTKICCFIAEIDDAARIRVTGMSHQASAGVRGGVIVDLVAAERAISAAVHAAEQLAGATVRDVVVNISGPHLMSHSVLREMHIGGGAIRDGDVRRLLQDGRTSVPLDDRIMLHAIPVGYAVDGAAGVRDPRGMYGHALGVRMHMVTASRPVVQNLNAVITRCHLHMGDIVASSYAAGLAALVEDETDLGVTVIDMGGGTTSLTVFYDGAAVFTDCLPVGGMHVTNDIARGLSTPLTHAERLKTLHGSALSSASDEKEMLDAPQVGEEEDISANRVPKSFLVSIIKPRIEETFELVRQRLEQSGVAPIAGQRVVLTGGASQLNGVRELAAHVLGKTVRVGRPLGLTGLAEATAGPAFATVAGLLHFALDDRGEARSAAVRAPAEMKGGFLGRIGGWFRENF